MREDQQRCWAQVRRDPVQWAWYCLKEAERKREWRARHRKESKLGSQFETLEDPFTSLPRADCPLVEEEGLFEEAVVQIDVVVALVDQEFHGINVHDHRWCFDILSGFDSHIRLGKIEQLEAWVDPILGSAACHGAVNCEW